MVSISQIDNTLLPLFYLHTIYLRETSLHGSKISQYDYPYLIFESNKTLIPSGLQWRTRQQQEAEITGYAASVYDKMLTT